ncbi:TraB/GumN family protein [Haloferula chungangensis]|uniref:TraB/GumN family protein n=1 Tax=Haloferula chungangensis TaxID=1048331 RepID=A0ABW2LCB2_9BACT
MKKFTRFLCLGLLALAPLGLSAADEKKHPDKPLLWKIEGKGMKEPSWLFGTIHIGQGPIATLHPAAEKAFDGADAVYTEVPMDMATQIGLAKHFIRSDGKTLADSIGAELSKQLDTELKAINPALDSTPFQALKTWTIAVTLPMLEFQVSGTQALDMIIWERASKAGKTTGAIEKPEDQFGIFDDLTEGEQVVFLAESVRTQKEARESGENPTLALVDAYILGDEAKIQAEMERQINEMAKGEHKELGEKLLKRLLEDRNKNMAKFIAEKLSSEADSSHFFAVGAGHYIGKDNVCELLTKKGYKVTRIEK